MLENMQKLAAQAIVNIFETGRPRGDYGCVTVLPGDTGRLTYGKAQTTLASGNLFKLINDYCSKDEAALAAELRPYLKRLEQGDVSLDTDETLHALLRQAGDDLVMQSAQDDFFDRVYWAPAIKSVEYINAKTALGAAIVYDSRIHGSWHRLRDRTIENHGKLTDKGEKTWFELYVRTRRDWLANNPNKLLRKTVYRMDSFTDLMKEEKWDLDLPLIVRGKEINEEVLTS